MDVEIKTAIENIGTSFEEFKKTNDERLKEIEKKGSVDPLTQDKLDKLNEFISDQTELKKRLDEIETGSAGEKGGEEKREEAIMAYKNAFVNYAKKGVEGDIRTLEQKALSSASDPDGGYTVTPVMSDKIIKSVFETSPIRQVASSQTISTDQLDIMADEDEAGAGWGTETGSVSETDTPELGKRSIYVHDLNAMPKATQRILDDSNIDIESWLAEKVANKFARTENTAFVSGTGVGQPRGFLTYDAGTATGQIQQISSTSGTGGTLDQDDFIKLLYGLKTPYQLNASFLMARGTEQAARLLVDGNDQYIWQPGLQSGKPNAILGKPTYQADDMPAAATDSLSVACGDFAQGYQIVDRAGIRILRDPFTSKPFVKFFTTKRVGGDVINFEAIKLLKLDA